jgi:hypothetical protein
VKRRMIEKLRDLCDGSFNGKTIAVLGVTFKPNTDDMREAPSLTIVPALVGGGREGARVDPQGRREGEALLPGVTWADDPYKAAAERRSGRDPDRMERVPRARPETATGFTASPGPTCFTAAAAATCLVAVTATTASMAAVVTTRWSAAMATTCWSAARATTGSMAVRATTGRSMRSRFPGPRSGATVTPSSSQRPMERID